MQQQVNPSSRKSLSTIGITRVRQAFWDLEPAELIEQAILSNEGFLADNGAFTAATGEFTGRAPKDRFIVKDEFNEDRVWWGDVNRPFEPDAFERLHQKMTDYLADKKVFVRDVHACADPAYRLNIRIVNTLAWHNLFCHNMFLRPTLEELESFEPNFTIICIPEFEADP